MVKPLFGSDLLGLIAWHSFVYACVVCWFVGCVGLFILLEFCGWLFRWFVLGFWFGRGCCFSEEFGLCLLVLCLFALPSIVLWFRVFLFVGVLLRGLGWAFGVART